MKCDKCGVNMYAMTPKYFGEDNDIYCEPCYHKLNNEVSINDIPDIFLKSMEQANKFIKKERTEK